MSLVRRARACLQRGCVFGFPLMCHKFRWPPGSIERRGIETGPTATFTFLESEYMSGLSPGQNGPSSRLPPRAGGASHSRSIVACRSVSGRARSLIATYTLADLGWSPDFERQLESGRGGGCHALPDFRVHRSRVDGLGEAGPMSLVPPPGLSTGADRRRRLGPRQW